MPERRDAEMIAGLQEDAERDRALVAEWDVTLPATPGPDDAAAEEFHRGWEAGYREARAQADSAPLDVERLRKALSDLIDLAETAINRVDEEAAYNAARKLRDTWLPTADDVRGILGAAAPPEGTPPYTDRPVQVAGGVAVDLRDADMVAGLLEDAERDRALVAEWDVTLPDTLGTDEVWGR